jgi:hypothetical protein
MRNPRRACARAFLTLVASAGCGGSGSTGSPDATSPSPVTSWPTFSGDCQPSWADTVEAINSNAVSNPNPQIGFDLSDRVAGDPADQVELNLAFDTAAIGMPMNVDPEDGGSSLSMFLQIGNTNYNQFDQGISGAVHGTVTVERYDAAGGNAEFLFSNAALVGQDAVFSGTFRCSIDGTLQVASFNRTALGQRCQTDLECGGAYSGRVCDNDTFVCVLGCRETTDCPLGQSCNGGTCS